MQLTYINILYAFTTSSMIQFLCINILVIKRGLLCIQTRVTQGSSYDPMAISLLQQHKIYILLCQFFVSTRAQLLFHFHRSMHNQYDGTHYQLQLARHSPLDLVCFSTSLIPKWAFRFHYRVLTSLLRPYCAYPFAKLDNTSEQFRKERILAKLT